MFFARCLGAVLAMVSLCNAHFTFVRLAHNGHWKAPGQYIRNRTAPYLEPSSQKHNYTRFFSFPTFPSDAPESIRCGRDNLAHAAGTDVLSVRAGDTVEFVVTSSSPVSWGTPSAVQWEGCPEGRGICPGEWDEARIYHPGAVVMHLSRVPEGVDIHAYDGSGQWIKFYTLGLEIHKVDGENRIMWLALQGEPYPTRLIGTLPKQTPPGKYLLRVDQVYYGAGNGDPQFYPSCVHIEVVGSEPTTGTLPEGIKIPEGLDVNSPGIVWTNEYNPLSVKGYPYPGGPLWDGETSAQDWSPKVE